VRKASSVVARSAVRGIAAHVAARVASLAQAGECLVSRIVKDLVAGADIHFSERGKRDLKGLTEPIDLFAAAAGSPSPNFLMSAWGQKQTFAMQTGLSALPPKADMCGATRDVR
jgi:hypothetical protein